MHCDLAQVLTTAWASHALATRKLETRSMHRTHQQTFLAAQEFAGSPIQATAGMRTHVEPCPYFAGSITMHDQRFCIAIQHGLYLMQAIQRHALNAQQGRVRSVDLIAI